MLATKLQSILLTRGKTADFMRDVRLQDDSDGNGSYIKHWAEAKLGPRPTQEEIDEVARIAPLVPQPTKRERLEKALGMTIAELKAELNK